MKFERTLSIVVFPVPVPPTTTMLILPRTSASRNTAESMLSDPSPIRSCMTRGSSGNFRMVSTGPCSASGGTMALIREPSASRASTIGEDSSTRRPTACTIRSMMRRYWCGELKTTSLRSMLALALDPDLVEAVAHDFGDVPVGQQRLERAVAERVLEHLLDEALALDGRDPDVLALEDLVHRRADLGPQLVRRQVGRRRRDLGQDLGLDDRLGLQPRLLGGGGPVGAAAPRRLLGRRPSGTALGARAAITGHRCRCGRLGGPVGGGQLL